MNLKKILKTLKLHEELVSNLLGVVILVAALIFTYNYIKNIQKESEVPPVVTNTNQDKIHIVIAGETLWSIAEKYYQKGSDWKKIADANNISSSSKIEISQKLTIPGVPQPSPPIPQITIEAVHDGKLALGPYNKLFPKKDKTVILVEDLISTGGSSASAVKVIRDANGKVTRKRLGSTPMLSVDESFSVLEAAVNAYKGGRGFWPSLSLGKRVEYTEKFVAEMIKARTDVVNLLMWEIGKTEKDAAYQLNYWDRAKHIKLKGKNVYLNLIINLMRGSVTEKRFGFMPNSLLNYLLKGKRIERNIKSPFLSYLSLYFVEIYDLIRERILKQVYRSLPVSFRAWYDKVRYRV